ncbi:hypothetical protein MRX96_023438 [Rhipicephalus microplus]
MVEHLRSCWIVACRSLRLSAPPTAKIDHFHDDRKEVRSLLNGLGLDAASNLARLTRASLVSVLVESSETAE